jgi:hypothetical protein
MIKEVIAQGKDLVEAKENARAALGVGELDDVNFEVLHAGSRGILGIIGVKPAKVRAYIEIPDREEKSRRHERPRREKNNDSNRQNNQPQANVKAEQPAPKPANGSTFYSCKLPPFLILFVFPQNMLIRSM